MRSHDCSSPRPSNDSLEAPSPATRENKINLFIIALLQHLIREPAVVLKLLLILGSHLFPLPTPPPPLLCCWRPHLHGLSLLLCDISHVRIHL